MTTEPEQLRPWMEPLAASIKAQLDSDFFVHVHADQDGDAEIIVQHRRYREPHGRISLIEDGSSDCVRTMMILCGVQGIGEGRHVQFTPDEDGVGHLVYYVRQHYKAVDFIRADAVAMATKDKS